MLEKYNFEGELNIVQFDKVIMDYLVNELEKLNAEIKDKCLSNMFFTLVSTDLFSVDLKVISQPMGVDLRLFSVSFGENNTFAYGSNFVNFGTVEELNGLLTKFFQEEKVKTLIENMVITIVDGIEKQRAKESEVADDKRE